MTVKDLIRELETLKAAGVSEDTELILFADYTLEGENYKSAIQMDTLSVSINGDCVQLFMEGE